MIRKLLLRLGYVDRDWIRIELDIIIAQIREEINSHPQYPNIGKKGCLRRVIKLRESL